MSQKNLKASQSSFLKRFSQTSQWKLKSYNNPQMLSTFSVFNPDRDHSQPLKVDIGRIPQYGNFKHSYTQDCDQQFNQVHHQEISNNPNRFRKNMGPMSKYIDNSKSLITLLGFKGLRPPFATKVDFHSTCSPKQNSFNFQKSQQIKRNYTKKFDKNQIVRPMHSSVERNIIRDQRNNFVKTITEFNESRYAGKIGKINKNRMNCTIFETANLSKSFSSKHSKNSQSQLNIIAEMR